TYVTQRANETMQLVRQKKGCDQIDASIGVVTKAGKRLPTLDGSTFSGLSSSYGDASDRATERQEVVDDYVESATDTLEQLVRDCRWNFRFNAASTEPARLYDESEKYLFKAGTTEPGAVCPGKVDCISSITKKKNTYA